MKPALQIAAILLVVLNSASLAPGVAVYREYLLMASLVIAFVIAVLTFAPSRNAAAARPAVAEAVKPAAPANLPENHAQAEVVTLLGVLQEKGRFIDFLMEDITPYSDTQVGSVARSVHQGCKAALQEHFAIEPVSAAAEGSTVTVPAAHAADEFRLVGNLAGEPPFSGKLVHKGWKTTRVKLPRVLSPDAGRLPAIAPAQVEIS
jgi:hypothetical protein